MKSRIFLYAVIVFVVVAFSGLWFLSTIEDQEPAQVFPASINYDCAPWDGAAFTVSVPYNSTSTITISIWEAPDRFLPSTFSFPDESGGVGNALHVLPSGEYEQLMGKVSFGRVQAGRSVKGGFNLMSESGEQFKGRFEAQWGNEMAYCG